MRKRKEDAGDYVFALAASAVFIGTLVLVFGASCPIRILFGIPCPGCGMTRALWLLCKGKVAESIQMHPMVLPLLFGLGVGLVKRYGRMQKGRENTESRENSKNRDMKKREAMRFLAGYLAVWAVLCVLVYLVRMYLLFPYTPPMVYERGHLVHSLDGVWEWLCSAKKVLHAAGCAHTAP